MPPDARPVFGTKAQISESNFTIWVIVGKTGRFSAEMAADTSDLNADLRLG